MRTSDIIPDSHEFLHELRKQLRDLTADYLLNPSKEKRAAINLLMKSLDIQTKSIVTDCLVAKLRGEEPFVPEVKRTGIQLPDHQEPNQLS